jgi:hypothetical protein
MSRSSAAPLRDESSRLRAPSHALLRGAGVFLIAITLALLATGTTYALWNGQQAVPISSIRSGLTSLTINGATDYSIGNMSPLAAGQSAVVSLALINTGSTPLSASVSSTSIISNTNDLASSLTVKLTSFVFPASCNTALPGAAPTAISGFTTTAAPWAVAAGATINLCLEVKLSDSAPASLQNGTTSFRLNIDATQVAP